MEQTLEDRLAIIRENLKAGNTRLMDVSGSFRVEFPSGQTAYIYPETYDNSITVRFETKTAEAGERRREADQLRDALNREISFVEIQSFKESQALKDRFVYTAKAEVDPSVFFHETIVIGDHRAQADIKPPPSPAAREDRAVAPAKESDVRALAEEAVASLEAIDAKMLRLSLDMMNLKRSSPVRASLTRIFRDALDADELISAIDNEAIKLTSENDREELVMIKNINMDDALDPVIRLLCRRVFGGNPPD